MTNLNNVFHCNFYGRFTCFESCFQSIKCLFYLWGCHQDVISYHNEGNENSFETSTSMLLICTMCSFIIYNVSKLKKATVFNLFILGFSTKYF